ncbi:uncharacterized protein At4g15970-like [Lolium rigidum]|uniref:uncharacterized protein At4g15970-like n=1 Tax=Lolium rigidum TaxID=89674 RepID=UPI001F5CBC7F|nr:uncharacterized protein At4g15970-like [Lolium rigidum]
MPCNAVAGPVLRHTSPCQRPDLSKEVLLSIARDEEKRAVVETSLARDSSFHGRTALGSEPATLILFPHVSAQNFRLLLPWNPESIPVYSAMATACSVVLLSPPSYCPCSGVRPEKLELPSRDNGTQAIQSIKAAAVTEPEDELAVLLRSAVMEDNTVIMTFTNKAWTASGSLLDLFMESFREGDKTEPLLKHLIIVAVDDKAFEQCKLVHPLCYFLEVGGVNLTREQAYMSKDYLEMMWARNKFQTRVLELGYAFLFTDMDILWFRNALLHVPVGADITISSDKYLGDDPYDLEKNANGGFVYARPNPRTIGFFKGWYQARSGRMNEQAVFDKMKRELSLQHGVEVHFIDTAYCGGFCQPKKDFRRLCTFHGNCLRGLSLKLERLRGVMGEWKQFKIARQEELANKNKTLSA